MNSSAKTIAVGGTFAILLMLLPLAGYVAASVEGHVGPAMTIAADGRPQATIIIASDANEVVIDAVNDLRLYIEKISGAKLPIANSPDTPGNLIMVGRMPAVDSLIPDLDEYDLGIDGIIVRSLPGKLILTGKSDGYKTKHGDFPRTDCGTPNAVYYFLESLGCRWYMPGEDGEVVPSKSILRVPAVNVVSKPDFRARFIGWSAARSMGGKTYADYHTWLVRNRSYCNLYQKGHSLEHLLPRTLGEKHPEYFALVEGKRIIKHPGNICTSNPEVRKIITTNLMRLLPNERFALRGKGWRAYPLGHYDAWVWCRCQPCLAECGDKEFTYRTADQAQAVGIGPSDKELPNYANGSLKLVNSVAEEIAKTHPDCLITYYALYNIPGFPEVRPRDNVLPVMCHIAPKHDGWREQVLNWEKISKQLYYYTYMGHRLDFLKLYIADDIRWCHQHKGVAMYLEHDSHSPINMVPLYLAAKALWDIHSDSKAILAEFYRTYYGRGGGPMRTFYETFDAATRQAGEDWDCLYAYPDLLTPELVVQCRDNLTEALRLAKEPVVKRRIESVSRYWRATELHVAAQQALAAWQKDKTDANRQAARSAFNKTIEYVNSVADEFRLQARIALLNDGLRELNKE